MNQKEREVQGNHKQAVALSSVFAAVLLASVKAAAGLATGSLGIIAEAAHSLLDLGAALLTYFAVKVGDKPPDESHPFGHEKVESLSGFIEVGILVITCGWILWEAFQRLFWNGDIVAFHWAAVGVMVLSVGVDIGRSRVLMKAAKKYHSQALEADALHFSSDIWSSLVVIVGLFCVKYGYPKADAIAAVFVAVWVLIISIRLAKRTVDVLLDSAADKKEIQKIRELALGVQDISNIEGLRVRKAGPKMFINMNLLIPRIIPLEQAHRRGTEVEDLLQKEYPTSDILIHLEPMEDQAEKIQDKVRLIANELKVSVHDINTLRIGTKIQVYFDLEMDKNLSFMEAHEVASRLENQIRDSIPDVVKVTAHLEPLNADIEEAEDITRKEGDLVKRIILSAEEIKEVLDCHHVHLQKNSQAVVATIHCFLSKELSLEQVHDISIRIHYNVLRKNTELSKLIVHCEPTR